MVSDIGHRIRCASLLRHSPFRFIVSHASIRIAVQFLHHRISQHSLEHTCRIDGPFYLWRDRLFFFNTIFRFNFSFRKSFHQ
ncbi:MAG: hypothetical protein HY064_07725 [Bacteroidetes bacterium]|nr:hypothetical protein [Bacteroidota bacterium]